MKKNLKLIIPALVLCVAIVLSVCLPSFTKAPIKVEKQPYDIAQVANSTVAAATLSGNVATQKAETNYAFGAKVTEKNGQKVFSFEYDGKTYNSSYERLLAEDGFMYGVDWDWFSDASNGTNGMGYEEINGYTCDYRPAYVTRTLYNLKALGRNALGTWIGPKGAFSYDHDTGLVTGLDETFKVNLVNLLESCRQTETLFVPCLLTHWYGSNYTQDEKRGKLSIEQKEFYFRFYHDEEAREEFLKNGVAEICKILADYQDVVGIVALTIENGTNMNDVASGQLWANQCVAWSDFAELHNAMNDVVKEYMPNVYTSVEDNGGIYYNMCKYNDLKVDLIGPQKYSTTGDQDSYYTTELMTVRPGYVGETNYHWDGDRYNSTTIEYLDSVLLRHYKAIRKNGQTGAFHFCVTQQYEQDRWSYFMSSNMDDYETMRSYLVPLSHIIHDLKLEHRANEEDPNISNRFTWNGEKPALFYNNDSENNYWVPIRGASYYRLERSENGGAWKVIGDNLNPLDYIIDNGLMKFVDTSIEATSTYQYRVIAVLDNGQEVVSDPGNIMSRYISKEYLVDNEGNYVGGFEHGSWFAGSVDNFEETGNSNGWVLPSDGTRMGTVVSQELGGSGPMEGDHYLVIPGINDETPTWAYGAQTTYYLTVPGNQKYKLSLWTRGKPKGSLHPSFSIHHVTAGYTDCWVTTAADAHSVGGWHKSEVYFTAPDDGKIYLKIMTPGGSGVISTHYVDNISITEAR